MTTPTCKVATDHGIRPAVRAAGDESNGGGQSKIAETLLEVGEKFGGFWYCFFGIERIGKATLISRLRHELRDCPCRKSNPNIVMM